MTKSVQFSAALKNVPLNTASGMSLIRVVESTRMACGERRYGEFFWLAYRQLASEEGLCLVDEK
jgi:hypothetical protein